MQCWLIWWWSLTKHVCFLFLFFFAAVMTRCRPQRKLPELATGRNHSECTGDGPRGARDPPVVRCAPWVHPRRFRPLRHWQVIEVGQQPFAQCWGVVIRQILNIELCTHSAFWPSPAAADWWNLCALHHCDLNLTNSRRKFAKLEDDAANFVLIYLKKMNNITIFNKMYS